MQVRNQHIKLKGLITLFCLFGLGLTANAGSVTLNAKMMHASNKPTSTVQKLSSLESALRNTLRFENYATLGNKSTKVTTPGKTTLDLGHGYQLDVNLKEGAKGVLLAHVNWRKGKKSLVKTNLKMPRGKPVVLGGVPYKGGKLLVTLVAK